jgi:hypothetical protein
MDNNYLVPGTATIRASLEAMRQEREAWEEAWRSFGAWRSQSRQNAQPTLADLMQILQQLLADIATLKAAALNDRAS